MKRIITLLFILVSNELSYSQNNFKSAINEVSLDISNKLIVKGKKRIVVLYITDATKSQTTIGKYMADIISTDIVNHLDNFQVFDRENLSSIVDAKKLMSEGYINAAKAKELGKVLEVDVIIIGNYVVLNTTLEINIKALDVNNGLMIAATNKELPINEEAAALLGINKGSGLNDSNKGFNNRPLNSNENYNNPETVSKTCEEMNTGDYCIFNNTNSGKVFRIYFGEKSDFNEMVLGPLAKKTYEDISLPTGQTQCIYNWISRPYLYELWGKDSRGQTAILQSSNVLIEKCKSKTYVIEKNNTTNTVANKCEENNLGDYCFQNNSKQKVKINYFNTRFMTLDPGQSECWYELREGKLNFQVQIEVNDFGEIYWQTKNRSVVMVEKCKTKTYLIN